MNAALKELAEMNYQKLEAASAQKPGTPSGISAGELNKNPLKFMTLFSSNPQLSASLR